MDRDTSKSTRYSRKAGLHGQAKQQKQHRVVKHSSRGRREDLRPGGGVFSCFSLSGDQASIHHRSTFSSTRKEEVREVRHKGACLRCKLLKRRCSGESPCNLCVAAAKAAIGTRVLGWMECIRPAFQAMNIFSKGIRICDQKRVDMIIADLLNDDIYLDFHIPFELNIEAASTHLASWLSDNPNDTSLSVVGVFTCVTNTSLLESALSPSLSRDLRLFVHLTSHLYTAGFQTSFPDYREEEIQSIRDLVGERLLLALDPLLRPTELEAPGDKLARLSSVFLLLLGTMVGLRYTCPDVINQEKMSTNKTESHEEALLRLLCHYLIFIGKSSSLLAPSDQEDTLIHTWKRHWNKPAAFTWNASEGLEMHYRIQPPADTIVSGSEDGSDGKADIDLLDLDDDDEFTMNADLSKCSICGTFWADLDMSGSCQRCRTQFVGTPNEVIVFPNDLYEILDPVLAPSTFRTGLGNQLWQTTTPSDSVMTSEAAEHPNMHFPFGHIGLPAWESSPQAGYPSEDALHEDLELSSLLGYDQAKMAASMSDSRSLPVSPVSQGIFHA